MATVAEKRAWLRANGYKVSDRGRLTPYFQAAYEKAHPEESEPWTGDPWDTDGTSDAADSTVPSEEPEPSGVTDETRPVRPRASRGKTRKPGSGILGWLTGGKDQGKSKRGPKPKAPPRVSVDKFISRGYLRLGQFAAAVAPATGRCLQAQSTMAGILLEDITRDTVADRILQPMARAEDKLDKTFALLAPPILVFALETGDPENVMRRMFLTGLLRESLLISMDVTQQYADQVAAAAQRSKENEEAVDQLLSFIFGQPQAQTVPPEPQMAGAAA